METMNLFEEQNMNKFKFNYELNYEKRFVNQKLCLTLNDKVSFN